MSFRLSCLVMNKGFANNAFEEWRVFDIKSIPYAITHREVNILITDCEPRSLRSLYRKD